MAYDRRLSKTLSYWLRHRPDLASLVLDAQGWTDLAAVLAAMERAGIDGGAERVRQVVRDNDKHRFELTPDGQRIRARQGHSVAVDLGWPRRVPPELLHHGTIERSLDSILTFGLQPMCRHHVHLSADIATARRVGGRRGTPVILQIRALDLHEGGMPFYLTANGVWLTEAVPPQFVEVLQAADR